jgi:uncharacterized protein (DUF488 family)
MKKPVIFTIGHSTHAIDEFVGMLQAHEIQAVADVRTIPKSLHNPQFNKDELKESLREAHIRYAHFKKLGGLRHAAKDSFNLGWRNASFRGFADYMASEEFSEGLQALMKLALEKSTAVMCAEAVPWRCHRSLIADALIKQGWLVRDIMSRTSAKKHVLTPFLKMKKGQLVYPAPSA